MMRTLLACVAAAALLPALAGAADDVMASRFGNTTITRDANGVTLKIHYRPDGTFNGSQGAATFSGTWKLNDKHQVCLTAMTVISLCTPVSAHKVGDTWTAGGYTVTLVKGIQ